MKVAIVANASLDLGTGHVHRTMTIAEALRAAGGEVRYISRGFPGHLAAFVRDRGFAVDLLPFDPDTAAPPADRLWFGVPRAIDAHETVAAIRRAWGTADLVVTDNSELDEPWERIVRPATRRIFAIDDLANRRHDCDLLFDQADRPDSAERYRSLVPPGTICFFGPRYALLREEFVRARAGVRERSGVVRRVLVFFSGTDPGDVTGRALEAIARLERPDIAFDVVVSVGYPFFDRLAARAAMLPNVSLARQVDDIAARMAAADLAFGGVGTTTIERAYLGLPALAVTMSSGQHVDAARAERRGLLRIAGDAATVDVEQLAAALRDVIGDRPLLQAMSRAGLAFMADYEPFRGGSMMRAMLGDRA